MEYEMNSHLKRTCQSSDHNDAGVKSGLMDRFPVVQEDKPRWNGFCEIESEPALFNAMLQKFGVNGIKVQEVVSLDAEMLALLPQPIFGLIFLFRWMEEDPEKQEQSCPDDIWFANQTSNNSCASVALLNIVNNIPGIELGDNLRQFKHFTKDFSPALRGDAINNFQFVKDIHNFFARKMDMLNADLLLKNEAIITKRSKKAEATEDDCTAGFHFIAFMPIGESLWKFDGLERQPMTLGSVTGDWLAQATPDIQARMAQYEESQIEFAILSLVKDPIINLLSALAQNVRRLIAVQSRLDVVRPDWRINGTAGSRRNSENGVEEQILAGPDAGLGLTQQQISLVQLNDELALHISSCSLTEAMTIRRDLIAAQQGLKISIHEEMQFRYLEAERARARSRDFGAKMQCFARKASSMDVL